MSGVLQVALTVVMALVTLMQLGVLLGFRTGKFVAGTDGVSRDVERRLDSIDDRLERASESSSKLASVVQGLVGRLDRLPQDLREMGFISHDTAELMIERALGGRRQQPRGDR